MKKIHVNVRVFVLSCKHACFRVNFPVSACFYPPLHHNGKLSIGDTC